MYQVPPTGFEPVHPPSEGSALSPELRGRRHGMRLPARARRCERCENAPMSESAYFATGCFWGTERRFANLPGVLATSVGFMGGTKSNPTYEEVCTGATGHVEIVSVIFDPVSITYQRLLEEFWSAHDPTSLNQQGGDIGSQYRSAIYVTSNEQFETALASREKYQRVLTQAGLGGIVSEINSAEGVEYFLAEEYHQKYLIKNPNGYDCHSSTGVAYPSKAVTT